jgi:sialic acid synthase SpsE
MNTFFAPEALKTALKNQSNFKMYEALSLEENEALRNKVKKVALQNGMTFIPDQSGTNIDVQIFDTSKLKVSNLDFPVSEKVVSNNQPVIIVMDYAFGEQAYETIDELLKPQEQKVYSLHCAYWH